MSLKSQYLQIRSPKYCQEHGRKRPPQNAHACNAIHAWSEPRTAKWVLEHWSVLLSDELSLMSGGGQFLVGQSICAHAGVCSLSVSSSRFESALACSMCTLGKVDGAVSGII